MIWHSVCLRANTIPLWKFFKKTSLEEQSQLQIPSEYSYFIRLSFCCFCLPSLQIAQIVICIFCTAALLYEFLCIEVTIYKTVLFAPLLHQQCFCLGNFSFRFSYNFSLSLGCKMSNFNLLFNLQSLRIFFMFGILFYSCPKLFSSPQNPHFQPFESSSLFFSLVL